MRALATIDSRATPTRPWPFWRGRPTLRRNPKSALESKWAKRFGNKFRQATVYRASTFAAGGAEEGKMGRGILLWLLGVPIPIIILIALLYH
jgi:hypothetical protein